MPRKEMATAQLALVSVRASELDAAARAALQQLKASR
jgi:hypothetical protein